MYMYIYRTPHVCITLELCFVGCFAYRISSMYTAPWDWTTRSYKRELYEPLATEHRLVFVLFCFFIFVWLVGALLWKYHAPRWRATARLHMHQSQSYI